MVSVLRQLQAEWNALVPQAQALNIRRVRTLNLPLETIDYRRDKLNWLRSEIERLTATTTLTPVMDDLELLSTMTFGVELEFLLPNIISRAGMAERISRTGISCGAESYNHITSSYWKITTDNSLSGGRDGSGAEIVSPVLRGAAGFDQLIQVCTILKANGARVNKSCGLHVHVGARDWQVSQFKNLVMLYAGGQGVIDTFMAPSRRGSANGFCQPISVNYTRLNSATTVDEVARSFGQFPGSDHTRGSARYKKLNFMSFWQHGTVEFRHHQGTVEPDKTLQWVKFCLRMCLAARTGDAFATQAAHTFDSFMDHVKAPDDQKRFFAGRAQFFSQNEQRAVTRRANAEERARRERAEADRRYRERMEARRRAQTELLASGGARVVPAGVFTQVVDVDSSNLTLPSVIDQINARIERENAASRNAEPANPFTQAGEDLQNRSTTRGQE